MPLLPRDGEPRPRRVTASARHAASAVVLAGAIVASAFIVTDIVGSGADSPPAAAQPGIAAPAPDAVAAATRCAGAS